MMLLPLPSQAATPALKNKILIIKKGNDDFLFL
jgi:hypothetical protein